MLRNPSIFRNVLELACLLLGCMPAMIAGASERPNLLIITVDDMNADSVGAYGCQLPGTTPQMDRLARTSFCFSRAHVQVGNCMPSRNVMWSGLYPHNNRVEGFYQVKDAEYPTLATLMKDAGYFTAIRHKVTHSTPFHPFPWDLILDDLKDGSREHPKDPASYGRSTERCIEAAKKADKPFCLMINIADPHKPFYSQGRGKNKNRDPYKPTRVYNAAEVPIPGFLFDDPEVRKELALYYSSVRRCDDAVGSVLKALDDSKLADQTFVMFLSDHGMPFPFAKTQLYHHSTHTPLMIRWPGVTRGNTWDHGHMVSAVDFLPTLLDVAGIKHPQHLDGRSFAPILRGKKQEHRDFVVKVYNENSGASRDPIRGIQTKKFLYLFNPWSNGKRVFATATTSTQTFRQMAKRAESNPALKKRLDLYKYRVVEELYDVEEDPDCLVNLIDSRSHQEVGEKLRAKLMDWMKTTNDHMLEAFRNRNDPVARESYVAAKEKEAMARRQKNRKQRSPKAPAKSNKNLIKLVPPESGRIGNSFEVTVEYTLHENLGEQLLQVTLKSGESNKRIERKIVKVSGKGVSRIKFELASSLSSKTLRVAAFVGPSYQENLQHLNSNLIPVK